MATETIERPRRQRVGLARWLPIVAMVLLMIAIGAYTQSRQAAFTSKFNLNGLLIATLPLALAAMGQASALMVRAFDVSVGALMSICLVTASFVLTEGKSGIQIVFGILVVIGVALLTGAVNVALIRYLRLSSIIATLATLSILQGISLWLRIQPKGRITNVITKKLVTSVGFVPIAFIVVVVVALAADYWLYRTAGGLAARAAGLDEQSALRRGVRVSYLFVRAFFISAFAAAMASIFLAAQIQIGDPTAGNSFTLMSIAAAVLGGASLAGGRGSFVGAVVGALFLRLIIDVLPFIGLDSSYENISVGLLTLLALSFYQAPLLWVRLRTAVANFRLTRSASPTDARVAEG
jgi:ribose transport system ATP-binding protein